MEHSPCLRGLSLFLSGVLASYNPFSGGGGGFTRAGQLLPAQDFRIPPYMTLKLVLLLPGQPLTQRQPLKKLVLDTDRGLIVSSLHTHTHTHSLSLSLSLSLSCCIFFSMIFSYNFLLNHFYFCYLFLFYGF